MSEKNYVIEKIISLERAKTRLLTSSHVLGEENMAIVQSIAIDILKLKKNFLSQTIDECEKYISCPPPLPPPLQQEK